MLNRVRRLLTRERARVILADDDDEIRDMLATALRHDGHEVVEAVDGAHLLAHLQQALIDELHTPAPDLVISDLRMPGHDGMEILAALREAEIDVPVLLISAYEDDRSREQAFALGAALYRKPFDLDGLLLTVRFLVA